MSETPRTALLLGGTGLVGRHLLRLLAHDDRWSGVVTLGRRPLAPVAERHTHHVVDFERLADHADAFDAADVFCALGTTIRDAGSREAFRRVDLDYPFLSAQLARLGGASQFLLVSALGADPGSRIFYNRTKGKAERLLAEAGFASLSVFRPSLLVGERDERRRGETVMGAALTMARPALVGPLRKYRATPAATLARAMVEVAAARPPGLHVHEADALERLAAGAA